jgi:predicted RecB family endonuclease
MSIKSYINNKNIIINIINKSININSKISSFSLHDNNIYDIIIEDFEDIKEIKEMKEKKEKKEMKDISMLEVIAAALSSTIKSQKIQNEIVSRYLKYDKK